MKLLYNIRNNIGSKINRSERTPELIYLTAFSTLLTVAMLKTTMFHVYISSTIMQIIRLISMSFLLVKIFILDKYSLKQLFIIAMIEVFMIAAWRLSGYSIMFELSCLVIAAKDVSFKKIVRNYFYIVVGIMIMAFIAMKFGWIEHIVYSRNGKYRYSFGIIYCTDFAAHVFYSILAYCFIKNEKVKYYDVLLFILLGCFTYYYCDARLDSICIFIAAIFFLIYKLLKALKITSKLKFTKKITAAGLIFSVPAAALISIIPTIFYDPSNPTMLMINKISNNRLKYGKVGIDDYGFKLFGQYIKMRGNGGTNESVKDYFFIDSSFLSIALRYGVLILIIVCCYYMAVNYRLFKSNRYILLVLIAIVAINSIVAHHFLDIAYNPFLVCLFANLDS